MGCIPLQLLLHRTAAPALQQQTWAVGQIVPDTSGGEGAGGGAFMAAAVSGGGGGAAAGSAPKP